MKALLALSLFLFIACGEKPDSFLSERVKIQPAFDPLRFGQPVDLQQEPGRDSAGRWFVVEQSGKVKVFDPTNPKAGMKPFINISDRVLTAGAEQGLLGMALDPEFVNNRRFYLYYTAVPSGAISVSRFTANHLLTSASPATEDKLFSIPHDEHKNHNGGRTTFGPDGFLYIGTGDGGGAGDPNKNSQNPSSLLGKLLRIDVSKRTSETAYLVPADNPFVGNSNYKPEIYALGLRNPWRFSFDRQNKQLWLADVGQDDIEEINLIEKGQNYGWPIFEGSRCFKPENGCESSGLTAPIFEYNHEAGKSITGGFIYRGTKVPALQGYYVYADFVSGRIWGLKRLLTGETDNKLIAKTDFNISSFAEGSDGELFFFDYRSGTIYTFADESPKD